MGWRTWRFVRRLARQNQREVEMVRPEPIRFKTSGWARLYPQEGEWALAEVTYVIYMGRRREGSFREWWGAVRLIRNYRLPPEGIQADTTYQLEFRDGHRREVVTFQRPPGPVGHRPHYFRGVGPLQ